MSYRPTIEHPPTQSSYPTILCVEDDATYLRLRKTLLEKEGYIVLTATTGSRAVAIMQRVPVSLVLSDHMLRGTTGIALAHQLKAIKPRVPFVLYSGMVPDVMGDADCFISKDETVASFLSIIKSLIRRHDE
ncbi:MAG: response regulator [Acidobacteria bacterium]|nr:MAG: response regulator [Acidobacteriota bacterium]PYX12443.1 MAG: response regulator [Acidobacteriota bacterium]